MDKEMFSRKNLKNVKLELTYPLERKAPPAFPLAFTKEFLREISRFVEGLEIKYSLREITAVNFFTSNPRLTSDLDFLFLARDRNYVLSEAQRYFEKFSLKIEEKVSGLWYYLHFKIFSDGLHFLFGDGEVMEIALSKTREVYLMGNRFRLMPLEFLLWSYLVIEVGSFFPALVDDLLDKNYSQADIEKFKVFLRKIGEQALEEKLEKHLNRIRNYKSVGEYLKERQKRRSLRPPVWWAVKRGLLE